MPARVVKTIKKGPLSIQIRAYADGRFGFDWKPEGGERVKIRCTGQGDAETKAGELLGAGTAGKLDLLKIDPEEFAEFLQWKATRRAVPSVATVVSSFIESKDGKGLSYSHMYGLNHHMSLLVAEFGSRRMNDISRSDVETWLNGRGTGNLTWNNLLGSLVSLVRFARKDGAISAEIHPIEQLDKRKVSFDVETYSVEQMRALLAGVPEEWLPLVAMGAFCGIRPQELCPNVKSDKPALLWSNILWDKGTVIIPPEVSKVGMKRHAVLTDAARAFLLPFKAKDGRIAPKKNFYSLSRTWKKKCGVEWIPDGLRHSYASYRLSMTHDAPALALELGNSVGIIHRHYLDLKHPCDGSAWFAIRPK